MTFICSSFCPCFFVFPSTLFFPQFFSPITISQDAAYEIVQLSYYHKLSQCKDLMLIIYNTYTFFCVFNEQSSCPTFCQHARYQNEQNRLGDILSQGQIVPTAFLGRQIVPSDKMSHFLPRDKLSHQTNCPISSPETKCPTDALIKNHCSTGIFRATNCPIRQNVPLSPRRQNVPTYALMHRKVAGKLLAHFVGCPTLSI